MEIRTGRVHKIRLLKPLQNHPLVRFTLETDEGRLNCLIAFHSLNFLADVDEEMRINAWGVYNQRGQFVVKRYQVFGKTRIMIEIEAQNRIL